MMRFMLYYMYEGKPHTLQDLRMQYQLPCGMVSQIQTKGFDQRDWRLYAPSRVWNCCRKRIYCTWVRVRSNGPRSLFCFRPAEIIHYSDSKISKRYFRAETLRAFSRNKTKVVERTTLKANRNGKSFLCTCCGYKGDADHTAGINIKARYLDKNLSKICEDNKYNHKVLQSKLSGYYSRKNELYKQQHPEKFVKKQNSEEQAASATWTLGTYELRFCIIAWLYADSRRRYFCCTPWTCCGFIPKGLGSWRIERQTSPFDARQFNCRVVHRTNLALRRSKQCGRVFSLRSNAFFESSFYIPAKRWGCMLLYCSFVPP